MKTATLALVLVALWIAVLHAPGAQAGDDDAARCAELTAQVASLQAENEKLRKANDVTSANLTRATTVIDAMTKSLNAMRDLIPTAERSVPSGPLVAKLRERIEGWHLYYGELIAKIGTPAVKPLLAVLEADPAKEMPWVAPVLGRIGPDAAAAVPFLKQIVADTRHHRSGTARFAAEALAKIAPARASVAAAQLSSLGAAIDHYRLTHKKLPHSLQELTETSGRDPVPYIKSIPDDPWGNPYEYRVLDRTTYQIRSIGKDGLPDSDDDIVFPRGGN